jgi:hypothetical protein
MKPILNPALGDVEAAKLTIEQVKGDVQQRLKKVLPTRSTPRRAGTLFSRIDCG